MVYTVLRQYYCPFLYMVACNILMGLEFCLQSRPPVPLQIQTEGRHVLAMAHFGKLKLILKNYNSNVKYHQELLASLTLSDTSGDELVLKIRHCNSTE